MRSDETMGIPLTSYSVINALLLKLTVSFACIHNKAILLLHHFPFPSILSCLVFCLPFIFVHNNFSHSFIHALDVLTFFYQKLKNQKKAQRQKRKKQKKRKEHQRRRRKEKKNKENLQLMKKKREVMKRVMKLNPWKETQLTISKLNKLKR